MNALYSFPPGTPLADRTLEVSEKVAMDTAEEQLLAVLPTVGEFCVRIIRYRHQEGIPPTHLEYLHPLTNTHEYNVSLLMFPLCHTVISPPEPFLE